MKYQLLVFVLIIITSVGCKSSLEKRIANRADKCENCKIRLVDFTNFQWDKMYVFNYSVSPDEVDNALGLEYSNDDYEEFTRPWIFVKNNKVVYAEDNPYNIEGVVSDEVAFDQSDSVRVISYTPNTAVFKAKKERSGGNKYYVLYQVK